MSIMAIFLDNFCFKAVPLHLFIILNTMQIHFQPKLFSTLKNYTKQQFYADAMSGIIVGIVALPLAIAFGIDSGVTPEKGIFTAIIAGFIISFFGGSKVQIGDRHRCFFWLLTRPHGDSFWFLDWRDLWRAVFGVSATLRFGLVFQDFARIVFCSK